MVVIFYSPNMMRLCVVYNWGRGDEHNTTGKYYKSLPWLGFPGGMLVKNPPANAGDTGSTPGLGGSHMLQSN